MKLATYIIGSVLAFAIITGLVVVGLTSCNAPSSELSEDVPDPNVTNPIGVPSVGGGSRGPVSGLRGAPNNSTAPVTSQPDGTSVPQQGTAGVVVAPIKSYTTRGIITELPDGSAKRFFNVHHERIESFQDRTGAVVGMKEMIMPFPDLAIPLDGFAVGQGVELTFEVRWDKPPRTLVTKLTKLPEGSSLNLSPEAK